MRKRILGFFCCLLLAACLLALVSCAPKSAQKIQTFESSFSPPLPKEWQMDNGIRVLFLEDHELPLVRGSLHFPGGGLWDKADSEGAVSAMGRELRE